MSQHPSRFNFSAMLVLLVTGLLGCFGPAPSEQFEYSAPTWPALEKLTSEELMMPIGMSADAGNWDAVGSLVVAEDFKVAVEEFASTPVPGEWATPERTAAKDKAAENLKALIEAAEQKKPPKELKSLWEAYSQNIQEAAKPVGGPPATTE